MTTTVVVVVPRPGDDPEAVGTGTGLSWLVFRLWWLLYERVIVDV